jgi:hypothetical protein
LLYVAQKNHHKIDPVGLGRQWATGGFAKAGVPDTLRATAAVHRNDTELGLRGIRPAPASVRGRLSAEFGNVRNREDWKAAANDKNWPNAVDFDNASPQIEGHSECPELARYAPLVAPQKLNAFR